jgi:membrane protease YdiL (CAAX protease family)
LTCPNCSKTNGDTASFCGWCGNALPAAANFQESQSVTAENMIPWRGGEVALGVLVVVIAMTPVVLAAAVAAELAGRYSLPATIWASSHFMGLLIFGVVWAFGLRRLKTNVLGGAGSDLPEKLQGTLKAGLGSLGLNRPKTNWILSALLVVGALGGSLGATALYSLIVVGLDIGFLIPPEIPADLGFPGAAAILTFEALAVWTPITEEIFFRGFVFGGLIPRLGVWWAMAASGLIFSLFHIDPGVVVPIFITGFLLAGLYRLTGSLWPGIVAHAGQNAVALLAVMFLS